MISILGRDRWCLRMCGNALVAFGNCRLAGAAIKPRALLQTTVMAKGSSKAAEGKKGGKTAAKSDDAADKQKVDYWLSSPSQPADRVCHLLATSLQGGKGGLKAATAVNVRHILCEKHSKATEALQKIQV